MKGRSPEDILVLRLRALIPDRQGKLTAARAGISEFLLSRWRSGAVRPNPKLSTLVGLANALGVSVCDLISEEHVPGIPAPVLERIESLEQAVARGRAIARELEKQLEPRPKTVGGRRALRDRA